MTVLLVALRSRASTDSVAPVPVLVQKVMVEPRVEAPKAKTPTKPKPKKDAGGTR